MENVSNTTTENPIPGDAGAEAKVDQANVDEPQQLTLGPHAFTPTPYDATADLVAIRERLAAAPKFETRSERRQKQRNG